MQNAKIRVLSLKENTMSEPNLSNTDKSKIYDPFIESPLSKKERIIFNRSVVYITLVSAFVMALMLIAYPSLSSIVAGLIWATPGLLILCGFQRGRAQKRIQTFHTFAFIAEIIFLVYTMLMVLMASVSDRVSDPRFATGSIMVYIVVYIFYVFCTEFGLYKTLKKHEIAYYKATLKD